MPRVNVAPDDIERFAQCKPAAAIEELIWNGLDSGGTQINIAFEKREAGDVLQVIDAITITDFGEGIPFSALKESFGHVGGSTKASNRFTPEGRVRHGRFGRGRFTFLVLGSLATWKTTYQDSGKFWTYSITVNRDRPDFYDKSVPVESDSEETGTTLRISKLTEGARTLLTSSTVNHLLRQLACYLFMYPNVEVTFDGAMLDVKASYDRAKQMRITGKDVDGQAVRIKTCSLHYPGWGVWHIRGLFSTARRIAW